MSFKKLFSGFILLSSFYCPLYSDTTPDPSPIQGTARPFGLNIVDLVNLAGSDDQSSDFLTDLPDVINYISDHTDPSGLYLPPALELLDPNDTVFGSDQEVRVYFIDESSPFHNSIGFSTGADFSLFPGEEKLIFPNAATNGLVRTADSPQIPGEPLLPGDFVDIGILPAGTPLNFFFVPIGGDPNGFPDGVYWTNPLFNGGQDLFQYFTKVVPIPGSSYLLYSVVDFPPDFQEIPPHTFFLVETTMVNSVPEPETYVILLSFLGFIIFLKRKTGRSPCSTYAYNRDKP